MMNMKSLPLDLASLNPREAEFSLSGSPNQKLTLCRWSLRVRAWAFDNYGPEKLDDIFRNLKIIQISEIAFFMLKEKDVFKTVEEFQEAVVNTADQVALSKALLESVGIGEVEIEKISADLERNKSKEPVDPKSRKPKKK